MPLQLRHEKRPISGDSRVRPFIAQRGSFQVCLKNSLIVVVESTRSGILGGHGNNLMVVCLGCGRWLSGSDVKEVTVGTLGKYTFYGHTGETFVQQLRGKN